jgi:hypothetical protein
MPPMFHSTPVTMRNSVREQRWMPRWALPASFVLHLLIAALLMFGLPVSLSQPLEEQAVQVDLVPPPKPSEKAKVEPSPPAEESNSGKSQEQHVETQSAPSSDVFQFGKKDAGPRKAPDGNSGTEDGSASPTARRDLDKQVPAEPPALTAIESASQVPHPADAAKVQKAVKLQDAKTLYSRAATGDPIATSAMGDVPRGVRAGRLCLSELREQLLHALPPYFPDVLPSSPILEVRNTNFRSSGQWYSLSYRCGVDADAMKVVSFAFHVGDPVPRSEWNRLGLSSQ